MSNLTYEDKLGLLIEKFMPNICDRYHVGDGSDMSILAEALVRVSTELTRNSPEEIWQTLQDPVRSLSVQAVMWFEIGLAYASEYGVPADISRCLPTRPI